MHDKIKYYQQKVWALMRNLQDVRTIGLIMFAVVAVLITWSGIKVVDTNYRLQQEIARLQQQNTVRGLENRNIGLQNEFYETDEYLELEARRNFGLAAPEETVFVVPKSVALSRVQMSSEDVQQDDSESSAAVPQSNFSLWLEFLFQGRAQAN